MKTAQLGSPGPVAAPVSSDIFADTEDVFLSRPDRIAGAPACLFSEQVWDATGVLPRRANIGRHQLRIIFPQHPAWSLRSREIAMTLLNSTDPRLLARSVSFGSRTFSLAHVRSRCETYKTVAAWQTAQGLPDDISAWGARDWVAMVEAEIARGVKNGTVRNLICAIRDLVFLGPILTGGGIASDPWNGKATKLIAKGAVAGRTEVIAPARWIPLIGACWTYIDTFAEDILSLRVSHQCDLRPGMPEWRRRSEVSDDELLTAYLESSGAVIPAKTRDGGPDPSWWRLSKLVTADRSSAIFKEDRAAGRRRREMVYQALANNVARYVALTASEFENLLAQGISKKLAGSDAETIVRIQGADEMLDAWIDAASNRVAVTSTELCSSPGKIAEDDINWALMERIVFRSEGVTGLLGKGWATSVRRRRKLLKLARSGRVFASASGVGVMGVPRDCTGFTLVGAPGRQIPWRESMSDYEARCELRALRASCYVFIAAITMMRYSEIQDMKRGCIRTDYGVASVKSHLYKGRSGKTVAHWWIIDEVATAIRVLERLSCHPEYLFARFVDGELENPEPGIRSGLEIAFLLDHLAATGARSGIAPVPEGPVISARALRRTTASISRELGGNELAVSHQLKHAINYGYSNVTSAYMAPDPAWADLLNTNRSEDNLEHMVTVVQQSARTSASLAGRGGERLTQQIAQAVEQSAGPGYPGSVLSDEELAILLRKIAPQIRFGPANACLYDEENALCRRDATTEIQGPLLGLCQPSRCANSVIGTEHMPVWVTELQTLQKTIASPRVSPPRRQALSERITDVQHVLSQLQTRPQAGDHGQP